MRERTRNGPLIALTLIALATHACVTSEAYRKVEIGMTTDEVLALLGAPDTMSHHRKQTNTLEYFGPKPHATYLALPDGTAVEVWSYDHFREKFSYVFNLAETPPRVVHKDYYHPDITY